MIMLKDNFLSVSRFMNICRKDAVENWRTYLLRVIVMYGLMTLIFVWTGYFQYSYLHRIDPMVEISLYTFMWSGLIFGCVAASLNMEKMKSKTSRLALLMLPATPFEKFFSRWLASTVVFIITFIIAFKLADYTRVFIYSATCPDNTIVAAKLKYIFAVSGDYAFLSQISCKIKGVFIINYFLLQSCFILGSSIWPKNSLIKTFASGFSILTLYSLIFTGIARLIFKDAAGNMIGDSDPQSFTITLAYVMSTFFIFLNWGLAYFRFKEAEIINRL